MTIVNFDFRVSDLHRAFALFIPRKSEMVSSVQARRLPRLKDMVHAANKAFDVAWPQYRSDAFGRLVRKALLGVRFRVAAGQHIECLLFLLQRLDGLLAPSRPRWTLLYTFVLPYVASRVRN